MKEKKAKKRKWVLAVVIIIAVILGLAGWSFIDFTCNGKIGYIEDLPEIDYEDNINLLLYEMENNITPYSINELYGALEYIDGRYDCSDFRIQSLLRIMYEHNDKLDQAELDAVKKTLTSFKYWMDQPGEDSMCYWSENHQILFAASEYLSGKLYPDVIFANDGLSGKEHMEIARKRILTWLEQRWLYGFTEWYSNVYYVEDIAPMSLLIDFADDEEIVKKTQIIMDVFLYDVATQQLNGTFLTTSGRAYERNRKQGSWGNSLRNVIEQIWGYDVGRESQGMDLNFLYVNNYQVPDVIREIGLDHQSTIIKASQGLDVSELEERNLIGQNTNQLMMQWVMEAFTNPEVVSNSIKYISRNNMFTNKFLNDFKLINISFLKIFNLLPTVSKLLNPVTNGVAIERANTYTYKTSDYMVSTAQNYHPGGFADQQHVFSVTITDELSLFHSHPRAAFGKSDHWVGYGRLPHSVQDENINLSIYKIPDKKGFMEKNIFKFTHLYFPKLLMDESILDDQYAFGREGDVFFAFIAKNNLYYFEDSDDEVIQAGDDNYWIFEISTINDEGSFEEFMERIRSNTVSYDGDTLLYISNDKTMSVTYQGDFMINGQIADTEYDRHESSYASDSRESDTMLFQFNQKKLYLDFYNMIREQ
ncbi:MAG: hypothetical protein JXQ23_09695 [Clostridia bacterium]|nr:hypothetical protein [Clostridia bacterium]